VRLPLIVLSALACAGASVPAFSQAAASSATSQRMAVPTALRNDIGSLPASAGSDTNLNGAASQRPLPADEVGVTRRVQRANEHSLDATGHKVDAAGNPVGQSPEANGALPKGQ
jgi:hypothetical protein